MKKLVIAAFVVCAVPALAAPKHFSAIKEAQDLNRAAQSSRSERADPRADRRASTVLPRASETPRAQAKASETNR